MRVAFLGFGLVGGSIAKALAQPSQEPLAVPSLVAWSPSGDGPRRAVSDGVLDEAANDPAGALDGADLVILAGPPLACLDLVERLASDLQGVLSPAAVVTDVASTKSVIVARALAAGLRFVGGHPMAGREAIGYGAADAALFQDRPWVVVPSSSDSDEEAVNLVESLALACEARPVRLGPAEHDAAVAAISHLPLVLAAALVEAVTGPLDGPERPDWPLARSLAASGWRDMTRLARGDPEMAAGILATNSAPIAGRLRAVRAVIDSWLAATDGSTDLDPEALQRRFAAARERLTS
jgi:prephenate dehydrogenase